MEKRAVGWMVTEGARLKVVSNKTVGKRRIEDEYYTGQTADVGGPKVMEEEYLLRQFPYAF